MLPTGSGCKSKSHSKSHFHLQGTQWILLLIPENGIVLSCVSGCLWPARTILGQCCVRKPRTAAGHRLVVGLVCDRWERLEPYPHCLCPLSQSSCSQRRNKALADAENSTNSTSIGPGTFPMPAQGCFCNGLSLVPHSFLVNVFSKGHRETTSAS